MSTPVVLITGALTGIGRAAAFAFAREGNRVVVSGRHEEVGQALAAELREFGGKAEFIRADVRHDDDVRSLVDQTVAALVVSMPPSTTPAPKASPARSPNRPRKATPRRSTPMCSARCSA